MLIKQASEPWACPPSANSGLWGGQLNRFHRASPEEGSHPDHHSSPPAGGTTSAFAALRVLRHLPRSLPQSFPTGPARPSRPVLRPTASQASRPTSRRRARAHLSCTSGLTGPARTTLRRKRRPPRSAPLKLFRRALQPGRNVPAAADSSCQSRVQAGERRGQLSRPCSGSRAPLGPVGGD